MAYLANAAKCLCRNLLLLMQLFDISTTVDPGYIISLIRKLLPPDTRNSHDLHGVGACNDSAEESKTTEMEECSRSPSKETVSSAAYNNIDAMETIDDFDKNGHQEVEDEESFHRGAKPTVSVSVGEDAWEEYGCILWDLSATRTHAELMVSNCLLKKPSTQC